MLNKTHHTPARKRLEWLPFVLCWLLSCSAPAQSDEEQARRQLENLEKNIKRITWEISEASTRRSRLQRQLRDAEVEMGKLKNAVARTQRDIGAGEQELTQLEARRAELEQARDEQQARIKRELRAAWQMGDQGQLKVLLNQDDPQVLSRAMTYYRYIFEAREHLLEEYRATLVELEEVAVRVSETLAQLSERRTSLEEKRKKLTRAQADREHAVLELSANIDDKGKQLKKLEADRAELEKLLQAIEEAVVDLRLPDNSQPFSQARGNMPWPVAGKRSNRFGRYRNAAKMRWQGVTIPAKEGTTVNAIHHGRVVYADWLRGHGLLLIIDHGEGFMSLYAHNASLLRDVGEWVIAGTPISTVGISGGQNRSALYFEVRRNGKPVDPATWCTD